MEQLDPRIVESFAAVQADDFARHALWREYSETHKWVQDTSGIIKPLGEFHGLPVNLSINFATIDGLRVMFYDCTSQLAHWGMVDEWMEKNVPAMGRCDPQVARVWSDATNFVNVLHDIERSRLWQAEQAAKRSAEQERRRIIDIAIEHHKDHRQYDGHWEEPEWRLCRVLKNVRGRGGNFVVGELTIARPDMDGDTRFVTAYSIERRVKTSLRAKEIEWMEGERK